MILYTFQHISCVFKYFSKNMFSKTKNRTSLNIAILSSKCTKQSLKLVVSSIQSLHKRIHLQDD